MKSSIYFSILFSAFLLASCDGPPPAERAEGNYTGSYTVQGFGTQAGTATITATSNDRVSINLVCPTIGMDTIATNVLALLNHDDIDLIEYYGAPYLMDNKWHIHVISGQTKGDSLKLLYNATYNATFINSSTFNGVK